MTHPQDMARALEPLAIPSKLAPKGEWTMEGNPSSLTKNNLSNYRSLGINRISMGVQSLRDDHLKLLGRVHDRRQAFTALESIFDAGFSNVSVDLLCGIPGQNTVDLKNAIQELTAFPITHLSCYLLTLPPHHPLARNLPNEDTQLEHLLFVDRCLEALGFEHYEISNFARPGFRSQHNLAYWKGEGYLGLGPSAHSFFPAIKTRVKNFSSLERWSDALLKQNTLGVEWSETLTTEQENLERWMLALRLKEGFPRDWLKTPVQLTKARSLEENKLLEPCPENPLRLRLTPRGFALSDHIIQSLA